MKKIITFIFTMVVALTFSIDANATEKGVSVEQQSVKEIFKNVGTKKASKNKYKKLMLDDYYYAVEGEGPGIIFSGNDTNYSKKTTIDGYEITSYYKKIDNKIVNYKNSFKKAADGYKFAFTAEYLYNTKGATCGQEGYGCVVSYQGFPIIKSEVYEERSLSGVLEYYEKTIYSTKTNLAYENALSVEIKEYDSKGRIASKLIEKYNESGYLILEDQRVYYSNGKLKAKMIVNYTSKGRLIKSVLTGYNSKGKFLGKEIRNSKNKYTYRESVSYYKNNKKKDRIIEKYNGKTKNVKKSTKYYKYRTTGKMAMSKMQYYNSNSKITKMYTYTYNKKGQKKSNKYGKSYKYVTYFKKNTNKITKVTRAKYNSKGKLSKSKKVKDTILTRTYYYIKN